MEEEELQKLIDEAKAAIKKDFDAKVKVITDAAEKTADQKQKEIDVLQASVTKLSNQFDGISEKVDNIKHGDHKNEVAKNLVGSFQDGLAKMLIDPKDGTVISHKRAMETLKGKEFDVELKVAAVMTRTSSLSAADIFLRMHEVEAGTARDPRSKRTILDLIPARMTTASTIIWREAETTEGVPTTVAEAAQFPLVQYKWKKAQADVKKIAAYTKFSAEMIEDTDYVETEIPIELNEDILDVLETQITTGDGTGNNLFGINSYAIAFARPEGVSQITNATRTDAIRVALVMISKSNFAGNAIILNPSDSAMMDLEKGTDGHYKIPPFVTADGMRIKGIPVIESNRITEGSFLIGDFSRCVLRVKREITYKVFDQNVDDAVNDLYTATMSLRAALVVKGPYKKAFVKGTFATAITALQAA